MFDGSARRFTFKPHWSWHAGKYKVRVQGEDAGIGGKPKKSDFAEFVLEVLDFNDAPVASTLQDQHVDEDMTASYRFKAFTDEETPSSGLIYSAHLLVFPSSSAGEVLFEGSPASEQSSSGSERSFGSKGSVRPRRVSSTHAEASLPDWISFDGGQHKFPRAHKRKVCLHSRATAHRRSSPLNFQLRRGSAAQVPQSPQAQGTSAQQSNGTPPNPSSQPPTSQGSGAQGAAEPTSTRYERTAERRRIVAALLSTSNLAGKWDASSAEPTSARYERTAKRRCIVATFLATSNLAGEWGARSRRAYKHKIRAHSRATAHRRSPPLNLQPRREVGCKFCRAHKRKVRAHSKATVHRRNLPRNLQPRREVGCKFCRAHKHKVRAAQQSNGTPPHPSSQPPGSQGSGAQGAAEQGAAEDAAKKEVRGDAPEQGAVEGVAEDVSEQVVAQDATSSPSTPASRKTDPLSDTELQKDLGGSELPTSVRISPHDIHTEITFISEGEVDVQLSLAEGAPMEISVRALARS